MDVALAEDPSIFCLIGARVSGVRLSHGYVPFNRKALLVAGRSCVPSAPSATASSISVHGLLTTQLRGELVDIHYGSNRRLSLPRSLLDRH